ncbi:MAG: hypothetical protein GY906_29080 [bacterium]|nr:hypothetical protein [bacterium]
MKRLKTFSCVVLALVATFVGSVDAGWWDVMEADLSLDLLAARDEAMATVAGSANAVEVLVAVAWWEQHIDLLPQPGEILSVEPLVSDPELAFLLARIEARLEGGMPRGSVPEASLSGPYGVLDILDLERAGAPPDEAIPPLPTPFVGFGIPFNLRLGRMDGWVGPPEPMAQGGVWLLSWTIRSAGQRQGWLVLEATGSANVELDGVEVARLRNCGQDDPLVSWFKISLAEGMHRLRVEISSPRRAGARLTLLDDEGAPLDVEVSLERTNEPTAESSLAVQSPKVSNAGLAAAARDDAAVADLLLAARLSNLRGDSQARRGFLERARRVAPDDPIPAFELARYFLSDRTGGAPEADLKRAMDHLRDAQSIPMSTLVGQTLAYRQGRSEDVERSLAELIGKHANDPRVLQLWTGGAIRRGWDREAEETLQRLQEMAPGARIVFDLSLQVLEALERWEERREAMLAKAEREPNSLRLVEKLATDCSVTRAVELLQVMSSRFNDPPIDIAVVRMLVELGEFERAREQLTRISRHWGAIPILDRYSMILAEQDTAELKASVERAISGDPRDIELRTLSWKLGEEPFFEPFRVDGLSLIESQQVESDADLVLLLDQAVEEVFLDGSSLYYYHGLSRVLTPAGVGQASELVWMPGAVPLRLRVHKPDGSVVVPNAGPDGNGLVHLADLKAGDVVEEEYLAAVGPTVVSERGHMSPYVYRFADSERVFGRSEYALIVPNKVELRLEGFFEGLKFDEQQSDSHRILTWRADDVSPIRSEPYSPPEQELLPWVTYGFGVSWENVGDLIRDRMLEALRGTPELLQWGREHLVGESPRDQLESLVDALVSDVEAGRRVLDLSRTAGQSFSLRRENRMAVLGAVLMDAGWTVDLLLSRPFGFAGTHLGVPNMDTFGIPLLRVEYEGNEIWLDLEEQRRGVGHIRPELQQSDALLIPMSDPHAKIELLEELPSFPNPELEDTVRISANVQVDGSANVTLEMPFRGAVAERMLQQLRGLAEDRAEMAFRQLAQGMIPAADNVSGNLQETQDGALLSLTLDVQRACEVNGNRMTCRALTLSRPLSPSLAALPERSFPLVLRMPILQSVEFDLEVPSGWSVDRGERQIETEWGRVTETLERKPNGLHSRAVLEVPAQVVSPENYPQFSRFCRAVDELMGRPPVIEKK